jgi:hypothetical protein
MISLVLMSLLQMVAVPVATQVPTFPLIVTGTCDLQSAVTIADGVSEPFGCDTAVITRTERGTVLIQFTDKSGDDGRILGFAGMVEGKQGFGADPTQMMAVERLYLAGGADPIQASRGTCIMNWSGLQRTGGHLTSVVCGARGQAEGSDVKALVVLDAR